MRRKFEYRVGSPKSERHRVRSISDFAFNPAEVVAIVEKGTGRLDLFAMSIPGLDVDLYMRRFTCETMTEIWMGLRTVQNARRPRCITLG